MLLVEDMPPDERVRKGNALFRTRPRDVEDTLAQLIHDENQEVAAAAIQLVEARKLWSLADDLEHVLEHRDAKDWQVFEAASWALAAQRMPAERRRQLWQEPLPRWSSPIACAACRCSTSSRWTSCSASPASGGQVRHEAGRDALRPRRVSRRRCSSCSTAASRSTGRGAPEHAVDAPAPLAFEEMLEGPPDARHVRALEPTISLSMTTEEFLSLVAENVELAQGIFRWLIEPRRRSS